MALVRPTIAELKERILADINSRLPGANAFLPRSNVNVIGIVQAGLAHEEYGYLAWIAKQIFPDTADTDQLDHWAQIWGKTRRQATNAVGYLLVTGTVAGTAIPAGTVWVRSDGAEFCATQAYTLPAGLSVSVLVSASVAGLNGQSLPGDTFSLSNPITGIDTEATVQNTTEYYGVTNGFDTESDAELLARLLFRIQRPPHGGAATDYLQWLLEVPGVTRGWVFPCGMGLGTVALTWVYDNRANPIPTETDHDTMEAYLENHTDPVTGASVGRPITSSLWLYSLNNRQLNPSIRLRPNTATTRANVTTELQGYCLLEGNPNGVIFPSNVCEAIHRAEGVESFDLVHPTIAETIAGDELLTLGNITWLA